jgi:hypothetical protein
LIALILVACLNSPALTPVLVSECDALSLVTFDALRVSPWAVCSFPALLIAQGFPLALLLISQFRTLCLALWRATTSRKAPVGVALLPAVLHLNAV